MKESEGYSPPPLSPPASQLPSHFQQPMRTLQSSDYGNYTYNRVVTRKAISIISSDLELY